MRCAGVVCFVWLFLKPSAVFGTPVDDFDYPTETGVVTCDFDVTCAARNHLGIDLRARAGEAVYAPANGVVREAQSHRRYGATVIIEHQLSPAEDATSVIGHMRLVDLAVRVGDTVTRGQIIGYAGTRAENGGWAPHVHWGIRKGLYTSSSIRCGSSSEWAYAGYTSCPEIVVPQWYDPRELLERVFSDSTTTDDDGDTLAEAEGDCDDENPDIHPGAEERCDNLDNNCAGGIDEEPAASYSCRDTVDCTEDICLTDTHFCTQRAIHAACEDGDPCTTNLCLLWVGCEVIPRDEDLDTYTAFSCGGDDCDDTDFYIHPGASERCNYSDDDCNGQDDDPWHAGLSVDLGEPCEGGWGECLASGVWVCEPLERGSVCSAVIGSPSPELCDNLDNDCDGETDEDWPELGSSCGTFPCDGIYVCSLDGLTSYCNAPPGTPELCDGVDNNCDGATDEYPAEVACADASDCTEDVCLFGLCQNVARDRDGDTYADDLCGGADCNDLNPAVWEHTFDEYQIGYETGQVLDPSFAWTGSEVGIAWSDDYYYGNLEIYFSRVDGMLGVIGSRRIRITTASSRYDRQPSLVWTGREYGLAWSDQYSGGGDIYFTRIDAMGAKIGGDVLLAENVGSLLNSAPSLAWTGYEYGVAYIDKRSTGDVYFARLTASGLEIGSEAPLVVDAAEDHDPSLVWTGTEYGLSWTEVSPPDSEIHFGRFTSTGSPIGSAIVVATFPSVWNAPTTLTWNGSFFVLMWPGYTGDHEELYFTRIGADGTELGSAIQITASDSSHNNSKPVSVWSGARGYGVLWQENLVSSSGVLRFLRLSEDGSSMWTAPPYPDFLVTSYNYRRKEAMVWTGHEYILAWADNRYGNLVLYLGRVSCGW